MKAFLVAIAGSLLLAPAAFAQGIGEMGAAYGMPKGGMFGLGKAVNGLYNGSKFAPPTAGGGGGQKSGTLGISSPAARLSSEELAAYTAQANKSYTAAVAAAKAGKNDVALREYGVALSVRERLWGAADPAVADIARKQAAIYTSQGKSAEALVAWRKVLASEQRHFGSDSPEVGKTLSTLATLCDKHGDNREALGYYKQLFGIQRKGASAAAADTAASKPTRLKVAELLTFTGDYAGAEILLKEAVAAQEGAGAGTDKPYLASLYDSYAALMREQARDSDASAMESKAAALRGTPPAPPADPPAASSTPESSTPPAPATAAP